MSRGDRRRDARRRHAPDPDAARAGAAAPPNGETAATALPPAGAVPAADAGAPGGQWHGRAFVAGLGAIAVIAVVAFAIRLWDLPLAPFHNDEGVNGWFTTELLRTGSWKYDPANYHGPTLFYAAALSGLLVGLSDVSMRLVPAVFGLATLGLALLAWRWIGRAGAIAAAALLTVSPGMVFFSRYAIHEMLLVFFTLAFVLAIARWWETGRARFLMAGSASLAGMFTTKETAIITVVVLALAVGCLALYERLAPRLLGRPLRFAPAPGVASGPGAAAGQGAGASPGAAVRGSAAPSATGAAQRPRPRPSRRPDPLARFGGRDRLLVALAAAAGLFAAIWVTLFTSLFTNPAGLVDSFRSLTIWTQTSGATQVSGPLTYVGWMAEEELPILLLGLGASAWVAWEGRSRFAIFAAAWATGLLLAYSLIGYKTPWLILNWLVPYALVAGYAIGRAWVARRRAFRVAAAGVLAAALVLSGAQAVQLAFRDYDREENAYVYVQTQRDILDLVAWLRTEDARLGAGGKMGIVIMSPDYWPLPWYLRDDPNAGFYGQVTDVAAPVQIVREDQLASLPAGFGDRYREQARYTLRPGVVLVVFAATAP